MTPKFYGHVIAGQLKLSKGEARLLKDYMFTLEGKEVEISIGKRKHLRSQQQMRYYWGIVVGMIAEYTGDDPDSIHAFLKDKFAPKVTVTIKGEAHTVPGCTHELFKDNFFADYVDRIRVWSSAELGVAIPDSNQVTV